MPNIIKVTKDLPAEFLGEILAVVHSFQSTEILIIVRSVMTIAE